MNFSFLYSISYTEDFPCSLKRMYFERAFGHFIHVVDHFVSNPDRAIPDPAITPWPGMARRLMFEKWKADVILFEQVITK